MPLQPYPRTLIEVPVSDRVIADTRIKQKARFYSLLHTQEVNGVSRVIIKLLVSLYAADSAAPDGYGDKLISAGFSAYECELSADNNTLVDPAQAGAILAIRGAATDAQWQATIERFAQDTMLQGDFFEYLREQQPILIGEMIRHHIAAADAMGRFA